MLTLTVDIPSNGPGWVGPLPLHRSTSHHRDELPVHSSQLRVQLQLSIGDRRSCQRQQPVLHLRLHEYLFLLASHRALRILPHVLHRRARPATRLLSRRMHHYRLVQCPRGGVPRACHALRQYVADRGSRPRMLRWLAMRTPHTEIVQLQ